MSEDDVVIVDGVPFDRDIWTPEPSGQPNPWWKRPDGSVHAFRGIRSLCREARWQANVTRPEEADQRCRECVAAIEREEARATA